MNVGRFLREATAQLKAAGISTARLDCLVLMEDVLNTNRTHILAHPDLLLNKSHREKLSSLVTRRASHEPLAYIRNTTEFYGRSFYIDHRVLEPRSESEAMIDELKALSLPAGSVVADIGTGSGALAITAKLELPGLQVLAIDLDPNCLAVARRNAKELGAVIQCFSGDLLQPLLGADHGLSVLLCNLPYVPNNFQINPAAMREPKLAIFGGPDGLGLYRRLFDQIKTLNVPPKYILTESLPPQHHQLAQLARAASYDLETTNDFIQLFRTGSERSDLTSA